MIVALGLPLKVAAIILSCIFSMLFSVFNALAPISNPTPPTAALTEFFHADTMTSDDPLPVSWYLISSVCVYLCSCMHIMSILCSTADAISSGSCPILFKVLRLNVAIWGLQPQQDAPLFHPREERCGLCMWFECGSWLSFDGCFILFYRSHSYRGAAVVPRSN